MNDNVNLQSNLSLIPSEEFVVFPNTIIPIIVKDRETLKILREAKLKNEEVFFLNLNFDEFSLLGKNSFSLEDRIGSVVKILYINDLPNNIAKVFLEGVRKGKVLSYKNFENFYKVDIEKIEDVFLESERLEVESVLRSIMTQLDDFVLINPSIGQDLTKTISRIKNPSVLADVLAFYIINNLEKKQKILEISSCKEKLISILVVLQEELELYKIKKEINYKVQSQMEKNQREIYLQEKIKHLKRELGEKNSGEEIIEHYRDLLKDINLPQYVVEKIEEELEKLEYTPIQGSEFGLIRSYLDLVFSLPWNKKAKIEKDIIKIKDYLEKSHYGMEEVKKRIIEMIAIRIRGGSSKKNVICLYGSPGTGKTSFAKSIAEALNREFIKISLGGIQDESEIRGHRRTYIGAMPGKIISAMKKAKINNPVILMDEIDKISSNSRGDPVAAMLEVLDPEQNQSFQDHYLDLEYDLSNVIFIATANSLEMSRPLLDRMEIIKVPSYLEEEKLKIAQQYVIPKVLKEVGLSEENVELKEDTIKLIIKHYTREPGLRNLERQINKIFRKINLEILEDENENKAKNKSSKDKKKSEVRKINQVVKKVVINAKNLDKYLGVKKYTHESIEKESMVGIVNGLAYSEAGGDVLILEAVAVAGKGDIKCTGTLGDVMKESVQIAFTFVKSQLDKLKLDKEWFKDKDIHLHVPDGATPKDGPSAGVAISLAIYSVISGKKVKNTVAMTGEISLRGKILPIGGLREKLTSAVRGGVKEVIIPKENEKDLEEVPDFVKKKLKIHKLEYFDDVLKIGVEG